MKHGGWWWCYRKKYANDNDKLCDENKALGVNDGVVGKKYGGQRWSFGIKIKMGEDKDDKYEVVG